MHPSPHPCEDSEAAMAALGAAARAAQPSVATLPTGAKNAALEAVAVRLHRAEAEILAANRADLHGAAALSPAMRDRLALDPARLSALIAAVRQVAALPDPVGTVIDETRRPNGLLLRRVRVPIGVLGIIFESRPNVAIDAAALALKSGNAAILRGGSEGFASVAALHQAFVAGLADAGLNPALIQRIPTRDRAMVGAMLSASRWIDLIIPRGGPNLVARVQAEARVPVLAHLTGLCHTYVDRSAELDMARAIIVNAKMRRTGICGATETLLIDRGFGDARALVGSLADTGCRLLGDVGARQLDDRVEPATPDSFATEHLNAVCSVALVDGLKGAMAHIARYGSGHTDAIVAADPVVAARFLAEVDSAIVMWNASTQFADGGEFGLGAEIGIATGRLHARGPVALEGLTTYKWQVLGEGHLRP